MYALSSAALTYTMARACSSGALFSCTCAQPPRERPNGNFKWGGCSDNLKWASRFVRQFVETQRKIKNQYKSTISPLDEKKDAQAQTTTESTTTISKYENDTMSRSKFAIAHEIATLVKRDIPNGQKKTKTLNKALLEKKLQKLQPYIDVANLQNSKIGRKVTFQNLNIQRLTVSNRCTITDDGEMAVDTMQMPWGFRLLQRENMLASFEANRRGCCEAEGRSLQSSSFTENTTTYSSIISSPFTPYTFALRGRQPGLLLA